MAEAGPLTETGCGMKSLPSRLVRHTPENHPARSDCERVLPGIGQPVNTLTSLGITAMGVRLARRSEADPRAHPGAKWAGWALVAAGLGSALYHGPGGRLAPWLHDVTLLAPPIVLALASEGDRRAMADVAPVQAISVAMGSAGVLRAVAPKSQDSLSAATGAALMGAAWQRIRSEHVEHDLPALAAAAATGLAGVAVFALSRTDGPLCRPKSVFQGHGLWHLLAAGATVIASRGMGLDQRRAAVT